MTTGTYYAVLSLHLLGATIWTGGHLVLAVRILPRALRERKAATIQEFEGAFERLGLPALVLQVLTGLALAHRLLGSPTNWLGDGGMARMVQLKLLFLLGTIALAIHAKTKLIPNLRDDNLAALAWHIRLVTVLAVLFVLAGANLRLGGFPLFD